MNKKTKFFFLLEVEDDTVQTMAHITSAATILFVVDLLTDWNPLKTFLRSFIPKISLGKPKPAATTPPATV